jgi:maleate isomerase
MSRQTRLGMLTPSSNTVLEPLCAAMLADVPNVSSHFARFRVTEISLGTAGIGQFKNQPMLDAALLLADAKVDVVCWNGTSAGWLGLDSDRSLCEDIFRAGGIRATSSVLALDDIFRTTKVQRLGLVTPYTQDVQMRIMANFKAEGYGCIAERHLGISENFAFAGVTTATLTTMIREVAAARPDAISVFCTNLRGAPLADPLERELGIPIYDSTAAAVWGALRVAGVDPKVVRGWGRLFSDVS